VMVTWAIWKIVSISRICGNLNGKNEVSNLKSCNFLGLKSLLDHDSSIISG
jgi:hypothetical protein